MFERIRSEDLEIFGLTSNEAKTYWSLLKLGPSPVIEIAKDCGLHRVLVYDLLNRLIEKGLAGKVTHAKKSFFQAAHPSEFREKIEKEKITLAQKELKLNAVLPQLMHMQEFAQEKNGVFFYKGKKGIKSALMRLSLLHQPIITIGSSGRTREVLGPAFRDIRNEIEENRIPTRMLYYETARSKKDIGFTHARVRFLPAKYQNPMFIDVSGHITVIIMLEEDPFAILIESQQTANAFQQYFEFLWGIAKD